MILDRQTLLSDGQLLTPATPILSTNTLDLGVAGESVLLGTVKRDLGTGKTPRFFAQIVEACVGGTTVQAQVVQADSADLGTGLEVLVESAAVPTAQLVPGYQFRIPGIPHGATKRYLGVRYVTAGVYSAGKVTAGIVHDVQQR